MSQNGKIRVGIVGLGIMGSAYASFLCRSEHEVYGFDVSPDSLAAFSAMGGVVCSSPAELGAKCDIVLVALASLKALDAAVLGNDGLVAGLKAGAIVCEMGTLPLDAKEKVRDALAPNGVVVLDCPVSGTGAQAAKGDLVIYASGDEAAVERARPVFNSFSREVRFVGPFGAGIKLKFIANLLVTIHNLAAAEAFLLAQKSGLDLQMVYEAVASGAGSSRMFEVRGPLMVADTYEPATMKMDVYMKDLTLILDHARDVRCPTPLMSASLPYYVAALAEGRDKEDTASLFGVLQHMAQPAAKGKK
ncbi:NAD(P)-dependent oxidoreductase [Aureimonas fodinaquatilis]|uniref:NAD(P)-dependent oxidoreductase n=1 Tax=Aureimonas fodinaquatilis TaxID=2565783 RepID=A0A5B0DU82_9HYPH|nr:NAD(P)-dependent oxidoreductase [Aureimonas fodinaquatilis]KAA0969562.1 NAD(P)-dependent oxidoreductase [Aureimonas fodinaquatilis]